VNKSAFFVVSNQRERKSEKIDDADVQKKKKRRREREIALSLSLRARDEPKTKLSRTFSAFRDVWVVFRHYSFFKYGSKVVPACIKEREKCVSSYQRSIFSPQKREAFFFFERKKEKENERCLPLSLSLSLSLTLLSYAHFGD